uniref:Uncharacterized protein n=1 Tax=viral metagenome TaxID=1070528 RepID=A0A6C0EB33_9ZZZZ
MGSSNGKPTFSWYSTQEFTLYEFELPDDEQTSIGDICYAYIDNHTQITNGGQKNFVRTDVCHRKMTFDGIDGFFLQKVNVSKHLKDLDILDNLPIRHIRLIESEYPLDFLLRFPKLTYLQIAKSNQGIDDKYIETIDKITTLNDLRLLSTSGWFSADPEKIRKLCSKIKVIRLSAAMLRSIWDHKKLFDEVFVKQKLDKFFFSCNKPDYTTRKRPDVKRFLETTDPKAPYELDLNFPFDADVYEEVNKKGFDSMRITHVGKIKLSPLLNIEHFHFYDFNEEGCDWICSTPKNSKLKRISCSVCACTYEQYERMKKYFEDIGLNVDMEDVYFFIAKPDFTTVTSDDGTPTDEERKKKIKIYETNNPLKLRTDEENNSPKEIKKVKAVKKKKGKKKN